MLTLKRLIVIYSVLAVCMASAKGQQGADPALTGWWKLDETSGAAAADSSGLGNNGTLRGGPVWGKGLKSNALKFDGTNDYVAIDKLKYSAKIIPAVSVATWIRTTKAVDQIVLSFDRDQYWQIVINGSLAEDGQIGWLVMTDAGLGGARSVARVDDGNWHHVATIYDNGKMTVYVDGAVSGTATAGRGFGTGITRYGFLGIGSQADKFDGTKVSSPFFNGDLDDVRIYSRALAKAEVEQLAFRGPSNDMCENAEPIGEVDKLAFDTRQATHDGTGAFIKSPNLWYLYTPSATGRATVSLAGSEYDTMVAVYRGAQINPGQDRLVAFNDDFNGLTSQLAFDATLAQVYLIEVGGFDNLTGRGLFTVTCEASAPPEFDLGDAPDSSNDTTKRMTAYTDAGQNPIPGNFPTVFDDRDGRPRGPLHVDSLAVAHLGAAVTLEIEADKGNDEDHVNNITPSRDESDKDGADDGVILPLRLPHGEYASFEYAVSVIQPNTEMWVNVWFDWNRDGDWDDSAATDPEMVAGTRKVSEWAVQNQLLYGLSIGTHQIVTPGFLAWHPDKGPEKVWMRITLSEKPWKGGATPGKLGNGGSGPAEGYGIGETEDYLVTPEAVCTLCKDRNEDNKVDFDDLVELMYDWLDSCVD